MKHGIDQFCKKHVTELCLSVVQNVSFELAQLTELHHEKAGFLPMRKQRRRSAVH